MKINDSILWAPWRLQYVKSPKNKKKCIFCAAVKSREDRKQQVVHRAKYCFVILNRFPYNNGHIMIAPYRHVADLSLLKEKEVAEMFQLLMEMKNKLSALLKPHGFNFGMNIGEAAGAGIEDHIHLHLVPRWRGDTNFMPVVGGSKVISQSLESLYESLKNVITRGIRGKGR